MTIDELAAYGADVQTGLARCMNCEDVYLELVGTVAADESFDRLAKAVSSHDLDAAFEVAHSLKGVTGNLALTPLYDAVYDLTELLRARCDVDYSEPLERVLAAWRALPAR